MKCIGAWFATLTKRMKEIAKDLAFGCSTSEVAKKYGVTAGRIQPDAADVGGVVGGVSGGGGGGGGVMPRQDHWLLFTADGVGGQLWPAISSAVSLSSQRLGFFLLTTRRRVR